ncbi:hypothetical protein HY463_01805 [Candidatus Peregrinibacteria bacterium]|nr:hypothetical protein [Candidatus Peregrinibacteria bacterium]
MTANLEISKLSDSALYKKCQEYGLQTRLWRQRFAGLLPEVFKRRLYIRRGFGSIHEFAAKLGGMSERSVNKVLSLSRRLEDKPVLKNMLESGEQSWSKIEKVAFIADAQNEKELAEKVKELPRLALEAYVQNFREQFAPGSDSQNIPQIPQGPRFVKVSYEIEETVEKAMRILKSELGVLTYNELFKTLVKRKSRKIVLKVCPECAKNVDSTGRYIPANVRNFLAEQYKHCGFPGCDKPFEIFHHVRRYALNPSHDPRYIVPLCKAHERLAHAGLIANEEDPPEDWRVIERADENHPKYIIDQKVARRRRTR